MSEKNNCINYIELPSMDLAATRKFYSDVFGWTFTDWGDTYIGFDGAGIDGGFRSDGAVKPESCGVLVVLYADDLESQQKAVSNAGGEIVKPIFSFPGGKRFHFVDPSGNELAVWSE